MPPLKVPTGEPQVEEMQIPVPQQPLHSPMDMAKWLKSELKIDGKPGRIRREPAHPVAWGDRSTMQPEFWQVAQEGDERQTEQAYQTLAETRRALYRILAQDETEPEADV